MKLLRLAIGVAGTTHLGAEQRSQPVAGFDCHSTYFRSWLVVRSLLSLLAVVSTAIAGKTPLQHSTEDMVRTYSVYPRVGRRMTALRLGPIAAASQSVVVNPA